MTTKSRQQIAKETGRTYKPPQRRPSVMSPLEFKQLRIGLGLSQNEMAELAGTGRATIINMETGKSRVNGLWKWLLELLHERENTLKVMGREPTYKGKRLK